MSVIISPPAVPPSDDPASLLIYHQQLAAYCMALLDEVAAVIPRIEETMPIRAGSGSGHLNIPTVFLGTAIDSVEQVPTLLRAVRLDTRRGRAILQLMETFRPIRDKLAAVGRNLANVLNARRSSLTVESLGAYDLAKCFARDSSDTALLQCVDNMRRDLGRRGRRKKM